MLKRNSSQCVSTKKNICQKAYKTQYIIMETLVRYKLIGWHILQYFNFFQNNLNSMLKQSKCQYLLMCFHICVTTYSNFKIYVSKPNTMGKAILLIIQVRGLHCQRPRLYIKIWVIQLVDYDKCYPWSSAWDVSLPIYV